MKHTLLYKHFFILFIFILPFLQIFPALYIQRELIARSPTGQTFSRAAWRDIYAMVTRQGSEGHWTVDLQYTTSPEPPLVGYSFFFTAIGQINRLLFHQNPVDILRIAELIMGPLLFVITFFVLRSLLPYPLFLLAYIFVLMIETGFAIPDMQTKPFSIWGPSFEAQQQLMERHFGLAHHTFGKAIGLLFSLAFIHLYERFSSKYLLLLVITGIVGAFVLPPYFLVFLFAAAIPFTLFAVKQKKCKYLILITAVAVVSILIPMIFITYQFRLIPAFAHFTETEKEWWTNSDVLIRYISSLMLYLPFLILSVFAAIRHWKQWNKSIRLIFVLCWSWLLMPTILISISQFPWFPLANGRLTDGYQYLPAGILSALGLWGVLIHFKPVRRTSIVIGTMIVTLFISVKVSNVIVSHSLAFDSYPHTNIYFYDEIWEGIKFLQTVPPKSGVLSLYHTGDLLPSYTDVRVYSAAWGLTWPHFGERHHAAQIFFSGTMTPDQVRDFLNQNNITYIFYGPEEQLITQTSTLYPDSLRAVFSNNKVVIFVHKDTIAQ